MPLSAGKKAPPGGNIAEVELMPVDDSNTQWATNNGCNTVTPPASESVAATIQSGTSTATHYTWAGCPEGAPMEHYKVIGGTHTTAKTIKVRALRQSMHV